MENIILWIVGGISAACLTGFFWLANNINTLKSGLSDRPTYKEANQEFAKREVIDLRFEMLQKDIKSVLDKLDKLSNGI